MQSPEKKPTENHLQVLIDNLRTRLLTMAASTEEAVDGALQALLDHNIARGEAVVEGDVHIDSMEVELDSSILNILARSQPVARDLRLLTTGIRLVMDLERIADEAVSVAQRAVLMNDFHTPPSSQLNALAMKAQHMLHQAITALREEDIALALAVRATQDDLGQMVVSSIQEVIAALQEKPESPPQRQGDAWYSMHLILITRSLERIGSRAINIAEHVYFLVEGVTLKHTRLPLPQETVSQSS